MSLFSIPGDTSFYPWRYIHCHRSLVGLTIIATTIDTMTGVSPVQSQAEALSLAPAGLKAYAALETLPDDILTHVLDELDLGTLARLEGVSRAISEKVSLMLATGDDTGSCRSLGGKR